MNQESDLFSCLTFGEWIIKNNKTKKTFEISHNYRYLKLYNGLVNTIIMNVMHINHSQLRITK